MTNSDFNTNPDAKARRRRIGEARSPALIGRCPAAKGRWRFLGCFLSEERSSRSFRI
jgi:hypothetical protein